MLALKSPVDVKNLLKENNGNKRNLDIRGYEASNILQFVFLLSAVFASIIRPSKSVIYQLISEHNGFLILPFLPGDMDHALL